MVMFLISCAAEKKPPVFCHFEKDAIQLDIESDPKLNFSGNAPHTLNVCFYQLKDPNAFNLKAKYEEGLYELLECTPFDPSVSSFERLIIQPGKDQTVILDRAEGTSYVGIAAGYYEAFERESIIRLQELVLATKKKSSSPWGKDNYCGDLNLGITFGKEKIDKIEVIPE
jgi:type VI secretion system VasD/TssJ family lipoprotein